MIESFINAASSQGMAGISIAALVVFVAIFMVYQMKTSSSRDKSRDEQTAKILEQNTKSMKQIVDSTNEANSKITSSLQSSIENLINTVNESNQKAAIMTNDIAKEMSTISKETSTTNKEMVKNNKELINSNVELQKQIIKFTSLQENMFASVKDGLAMINNNKDNVAELKNQVERLVEKDSEAIDKINRIEMSINSLDNIKR